MNIPGYNEFELDVEKVLREQLPPFFDDVQPATLTPENIQLLPPQAKGAYLLLHDGVEIYAGKTDARHGFRNRLERHHYSIQHRRGLDSERVSFKAIRIWVFSALDVESLLINELKNRRAGALAWNFSGFGSNDPGRKREGQQPADFDLEYPIYVERPLPFMPAGDHTIHDVLQTLKNGLPYLLRYQTRGDRARSGHDEYRDSNVRLPTPGMSALEVMKAIVEAFPDDSWQATIFPSRIILYKKKEDFEFASYIIRKGEVIEKSPHR